MLLVAVAVLPGLITFVEWGTQSTAYAERVVTAPELSADKGGAPQEEAVSLSTSQIEAWRALAVKPVLPEEVQRYWVAAEDALENKAFQKAAGYYGKGLKVEPLWPQGQYMAAIIESELHQYGRAAVHMKNYLALVPDAKDAKALRDKMYLWEVKAGEAPSRPATSLRK
jgi:hypothetical protein